MNQNRYRVESRNSPTSMGEQRRIVSLTFVGPWTEIVGGGATTQAWKAYKKARKLGERRGN